ncbi:MAG: hypothetical protein V1644_03690 [Candidatus Micrarchaeota archaeon]
MKRLFLLLILSVFLLGCVSAPVTTPSGAPDELPNTATDAATDNSASSGVTGSSGQQTAQQQSGDSACASFASLYTINDAASLLGSDWTTQGAQKMYKLGSFTACHIKFESMLDSGMGRIEIYDVESYTFTGHKENVASDSTGCKGIMVDGVGDEALFLNKGAAGVNCPLAPTEVVQLYVKKGTRYFNVVCSVSSTPCTDEQFKSIASTIASRV